MTALSQNNANRHASDLPFRHVILALCLMLVVFFGTDLFNIVLWQNNLANKLEILMLLPAMAITALYYRHLIRGAFASPELAILVIWALVSTTISSLPAYSFERCVPLVVTTAFALFLGSIMSLRGLLLFMASFYAVVMLLTMGAIAALPQARGIPPWGDTWNGIFLHKNGLGAACVMTLLTSFYAIGQVKGKLKLVFQVTFFLGLLLLVASESRTSQVVALVSMSALVVSRIIPRFEVIWAICFILFSVLLISLIAFLLSSPLADPLFALIGRKPTLSERIPIWELTWPYVMDRFWLGWGYGVFWHPDSSHLAWFSNKANLGFTPFYSHNGLIETWLNTGFLGVALLGTAIVRFFFSAFFSMRFVENRAGIVCALALMVTYLLANITESTLLGRLEANWIFFVAYVTKMNLVARAIRDDAKFRDSTVAHDGGTAKAFGLAATNRPMSS
ncbi:O-antigen ligase family protein [Ruegeria profundi]|uniref:O-antigen ligase family protein n=1 Tax=Ruegeria profundi TaxID=1685378 RepID=UPI001CD2CB61|nr:O-antigen ligase family protein [Ruegeria profundi]MCA0929564.1 O-antigen ligase family protein [Ruegeria profundi]